MRLRWLLLVAALLSACSAPKEAPLPPGAVVLALGDSITAGYGVDQDQAWPALLAQRSGWVVVNGGVTGDRSGDALARLPGLLDEHGPALLLLEIGGNDMLRKLPLGETVSNIERILDLARQRGVRTVLMAIPRPSVAGAVFASLSPAGFYREVAERNHIPLLEDEVSEVLSQREFTLDPLHPNAAGHAALAEKSAATLREIGLLR